MVVKDKIGRRRYIIVHNEPLLRRIIHEIRKIDETAKIVYFEKNYAMIRCRHWYKEQILQYLHQHGIKSYITTGTIKKGKRLLNTIKIKESEPR